jgi:hypothetical protein
VNILSDVVRRRLANSLLTATTHTRASDVVRTLGAVQAQDYAGAKWALAQRTRGVTDAEVEREISHGHILRTHVLRPTWHFVAPEDIRWMLAITGPRVNAAMASFDRYHELTPAEFRRSNDVLAKALSGGTHLTRAELRLALERARIRTTSGQRLARLVMRAELDAVICSGARRGKQFTYALLDERVPPTTPLERDEALLELARRYFTTRGPATARDFAWWSGLNAADAKRALALARTELTQVALGEDDAWLAPKPLPRRASSAHLLPNYDEYFIGYKDRSAVGQRIGHAKPVIGGDASVAHVLFIDGQIVGRWKRRVDNEAVVLEITLWSPLTPAERRRVAAAVQSFRAFIDAPVETRGITL